MVDLYDGLCVFDVCVVLGGKVCYLLECVCIDFIVLEFDVKCVECICDNLMCLWFDVKVVVGDVGVLFVVWKK